MEPRSYELAWDQIKRFRTGGRGFAAAIAAGRPLPGDIFCAVRLAGAAALTRVILHRRATAAA